jgi:hypothetical protein
LIVLTKQNWKLKKNQKLALTDIFNYLINFSIACSAPWSGYTCKVCGR